MQIIENVYSWASILDEATLKQALITSRCPVVFRHVALMPDAHLGIGATVGSVIATKNAIIPAAVGVDIGCGMIAVKTTLTKDRLPENMAGILRMFRASIPTGTGGSHKEFREQAVSWLSLYPQPVREVEKFQNTAALQLGTLGSGNHFLEICLDEYDSVWVVLHSGSRGPGNRLAQFHTNLARSLHDKAGTVLEDKNLAWFDEGTFEFDEYIADMTWAQNYALQNRIMMMDAALKDLFEFVGFGEEVQRINCHHNFAAQEFHFDITVWVTRKGAIRAELGDLGIVPGSMGTQSYIVEGLGNPLSFHSSAHGAGRIMSRAAAKKKFTTASLEKLMAGKVWDSFNAKGLIDEHPEAYKSIDTVMEDQRDLTRSVHTLRQIVNYKGT